MKAKVLSSTILGVALLAASTAVFADGPTYTGQCPNASEIQAVPADVTINGKPVPNAYSYMAFTGHNGVKMFVTLKYVVGKKAVSAFTGAYLNTAQFGRDVLPVVCSYRLADGSPLIMGAIDPAAPIEDLKPKGANWSDSLCHGSSPSDCEWSNHIDPNNPHARAR
jgi:hypothetical protein